MNLAETKTEYQNALNAAKEHGRLVSVFTQMLMTGTGFWAFPETQGPNAINTEKNRYYKSINAANAYAERIRTGNLGGPHIDY